MWTVSLLHWCFLNRVRRGWGLNSPSVSPALHSLLFFFMPPFFFPVVLHVWLAVLKQRSEGIQILRFSSPICLFLSLSAREVFEADANWNSPTFELFSNALHFTPFCPNPCSFFLFFPHSTSSRRTAKNVGVFSAPAMWYWHIFSLVQLHFSPFSQAFKLIHASPRVRIGRWGFDMFLQTFSFSSFEFLSSSITYFLTLIFFSPLLLLLGASERSRCFIYIYIHTVLSL